MEDTSNPPRRSNFFRFILLALLFLINCVAGYLSSYRWGVDEKRNATVTVV